MGSKRSINACNGCARFFDGMRQLHVADDEVIDGLPKAGGIREFGFLKRSFSSFASLVLYSSWFKLHHPAVLRALLRAQPMGFYSPQLRPGPMPQAWGWRCMVRVWPRGLVHDAPERCRNGSAAGAGGLFVIGRMTW